MNTMNTAFYCCIIIKLFNRSFNKITPMTMKIVVSPENEDEKDTFQKFKFNIFIMLEIHLFLRCRYLVAVPH